MATRISNISADLSATVGNTTLTILPVELVSIIVQPASATISDSGTQQYTAYGIYNDASVVDLTNQVTWLSSDNGVAYFDDQAYPTGTAIARSVSWFSSTYSGDLASTDANLSMFHKLIDPYGPSTVEDTVSNIDMNSEYWRIMSPLGGLYSIAVRYSGSQPTDPGYPSATLYNAIPDSRLWVARYDPWGVTVIHGFNDDAEAPVSGQAAPLPSSLNTGSNYWSYLELDMQPYWEYWLEVSSFNPLASGALDAGTTLTTYELQFAKLDSVPENVDIQAELITNPYYGYYVDSNETASTNAGNLGAVAYSGSTWWLNNVTETTRPYSPVCFDINNQGGIGSTGPYPYYPVITNLGFVTASVTSTLDLSTATVYGNDGAYTYFSVAGEGDFKVRVGNLEFSNSGSVPPPGTYRILVAYDYSMGVAGYQGDGNGSTNVSFETLTNFTFDILAEPRMISGLAGFVIAGNPNYVLGTSSVSYLEAYPMWAGTNAGVYMTASTATPDPPKTGHAAFSYSFLQAKVVVSSSATSGNYRWDGTYNNINDGGGPWQKYGYPVYSPGEWFLTKGYAGDVYTGPTDIYGRTMQNNWIWVYNDNTFSAWINDVGVQHTILTGTNYYAQTRLFEDFYPNNNNEVMLEGAHQARVLHVIAYGPDYSGSFVDLDSVNIFLRDQDAVGPNPIPHKKLNDSEILCWLPSNQNLTYWPDFFNPGAVVLRFNTPGGSWDSTTPFYVGVSG